MKDTLLLFGIFAILTLFATIINGSSLDNSEMSYRAEVQQIALSNAQQLLDQIANAEFDERTIGVSKLPPDSSLTPSASFGLEAGETVPDDIDDYMNMTIIGDTSRYEGIVLHVDIAYADTSNPLNNSLTQTRFKRITITASDDRYLKNSLVLSTVVSIH